MADRPHVLIEDWLPVRELGIESRRERAAASALPPLSFLHVWWARRPLVASAGVVLAGLLPAWSPEVAAAFPHANELKSEGTYKAWLLHLCGIWGDPISARAAIDRANAEGRKLKGNGYGYKQAFRNSLGRADIDLLHAVLRHTWGGELPVVADPTAGGGSIPFTAVRLGIPTYANDLNGVAAAVLQAGVAIPAQHGLDLASYIEKWGKVLVERVRERLKPYFPLENGESIIAYIWAHAVACPRTRRTVPLVTDWWLRKDHGKEVAARLVTKIGNVELSEPRFEIVRGSALARLNPAKGIMAHGSAVSPYDHLAIDGSYIKSEAQAGRMGQILYAVAIRRPDGVRDFRAPTQPDLDAIEASAKELDRVRSDWAAGGILPTEEIDTRSNYERGHRLYGIATWSAMFTPRQLLVHGTFAEEFQRIIPEVRADLGDELGDATLCELALMQGVAINWNARSSSWNVGRQGLRSVFDKHNFSFKWTFAEFDGAQALYPWCLFQVTDSYTKIANLYDKTGTAPLDGAPLAREVAVTRRNAADLCTLADGSVAHLCMDPPYYDNVMYAELADFFYVWEKRTLGRILPGYFTDDLTDKDNEAVANPARFAAMGRRKKELADADYEAKMTAIFAECGRVLRDDGVLTVMFTHKRARNWIGSAVP
jgi:putative DNA methylase